MTGSTDGPHQVGSRVALRYRLPENSSHAMTDVIGELTSSTDVGVTVRTAQGRVVQVVRDRVVALKALSPRPIRNSEIRSLEYAAADGWPGVEQHWIDGWLLRYGNGFTGRANSAEPLEAGASIGALDAIREWYAARNVPARLLIPSRIGVVPPGWTSVDDNIVMAAAIDNLALPTGPPAISVDDAPDDNWLSLYRYRDGPLPTGARDVIASVRGGVVGFATVSATDTPGPDISGPLAIARGAVTNAPDGRGWVGLTGVEVHAAHRRQGLGTLVCMDTIRWGRSNGATHTYLQVSAANHGAIAMYQQLGFAEHHRYVYANFDPVGGPR